MAERSHVPEMTEREAQDRVLGYLNFSSGSFDPTLFAGLNTLYRHAPPGPRRWEEIGRRLREGLGRLQAHSEAFRDAAQGERLLELVLDHALPAYQAFHRDLLPDPDPEFLFQPFFVGRVIEAVLRAGPPWEDTAGVIEQALSRLNDFVGHRPVAVLETHKAEVYPHERCRPIPLYIRRAGVGEGPACALIARTLELLQATDPDLLRDAYFDLDQLDELAVDPRGHDFDHPVNKRPNYHFGQWDPHHIDQRGLYDRFVLQNVTLTALLGWLEEGSTPDPEERRTEAAAVLAGTILMASGVSGNGPGAHDSTVSLGTLMPRIARYRDAFYKQLLHHIPRRHALRLRQEAQRLHQPFAAVRQYLNTELARRRAAQRERVAVAKIFARMGYAAAAGRQIEAVGVPAARMTCQIECLLAKSGHLLAAGELAACYRELAEAWEVMRRGIACGAIVDPWNVLGFDGNFSLFPALENSVPDERIDELVRLVEQIQESLARLWSIAAAQDQDDVAQQTSDLFQQFAEWWNQFAAHEVQALRVTPPLAAYRSASRVAEALREWHRAGAAAGNIGFWAPFVSSFESPRAYGLVIEALLERHDFSASRNLLVHWLSQADHIPLESGTTSFTRYARQWLTRVLELPDGDPQVMAERWSRVTKFLDFLDANAGSYGEVPRWEGPGTIGHQETGADPPPDEDDDDEQEQAARGDNLFDAAYEGVVYRDSTDDNIDSSVFERSDEASMDELERAARQLSARLVFLECWADMCRSAGLARMAIDRVSSEPGDPALFAGWVARLSLWRAELMELIETIHQWRLIPPTGDVESILNYDRHRLIKESLLERVIVAQVEICMAEATLQGVRGPAAEPPAQTPPDMAHFMEFIAHALHASPARTLQQKWNQLRATLEKLPILYVPVARGGSPGALAVVRRRQRMIGELFEWLRHVGMVEQARQLVETARTMERRHPVGPAAVTEFDSLFEAGFRALAQALIDAPDTEPSASARRQPVLEVMEHLTESMLLTWITHSRTLRLSVLEKVRNRQAWEDLSTFIQRYGAELFDQTFLMLGNIRGILHQGVDRWLRQLEEEHRTDDYPTLFRDLDQILPRSVAADMLTLILEAVMEGYEEYRDYNSTTTQSDRGDELDTFLDFLRLQAGYERVMWNMRPVVLAHEILVRNGLESAAQQWRLALTERIGGEADRYLERLERLQRKYGMRLASVADRLGQRFLQPLVVDRVRALVGTAIGEASTPGPHAAFALLEQEVEQLLAQPSGSGWDLPEWLEALAEEVDGHLEGEVEPRGMPLLRLALPPQRAALRQLAQRLRQWDVRRRRKT